MLPALKLGHCDHKAAKYAVEHWHYSERMPVGKIIKFGVWEGKEFIGAVLFARGSSPHLGTTYGLDQTQVCELVRVALHRHQHPVSKIVAIAIKLLKKTNPGLRLIVSFADPMQGHSGKIYQAMNWVYTGQSATCKFYFHENRWKHPREATGGAFGGKRKIQDYKSLPTKKVPGKFRYLYPLDKAMAEQIKPLAHKYPNCVSSIASDAPSNHEGQGSATLTDTLHIQEKE